MSQSTVTDVCIALKKQICCFIMAYFPWSTRLQGQFENEVNKSDSLISHLTQVIRYVNDGTNKEINISETFIRVFQSVSLQIQAEWTRGQQILSVQKKSTTNREIFKSKKESNKSNTSSSPTLRPKYAISSLGSIPYHQQKAFSDEKDKATANIYTAEESPLNNETSQKCDEALAQQQMEFVPWKSHADLSDQSIADRIQQIKTRKAIYWIEQKQKLNLESLLEMTKDLNEVVNSHQSEINHLDSNVGTLNSLVLSSVETLRSIRKSKWTYGIMGGMGAVALGGPALAVGWGIKTAVGGSFGLAAVGAISGSSYASHSNSILDQEFDRK
ncbi:hypothetical protein RFI_09254 [Reticulomyxa filosa]|uniref:t-SNARE coiled-coil homology domain-containing protein n=1 Tax=Reticulomyxa filosa TaxID=46433 RepID=X6NPQ7_RETFI|nr:hypothetical protein RFI_09254 [Reticulomyxa filosa]|eukprot:ETO27878.1 hypothetical protein RFI_09254 [Reticulomyxa filosa]